MEDRDSKENDSLDKSLDVTYELDQTDGMLKPDLDAIDAINAEQCNKEIFNPKNAIDDTIDSDHESIEESKEKIIEENNVSPNDEEHISVVKRYIMEGVCEEEAKRYGPATRKWKEIIIKHKILDPEKWGVNGSKKNHLGHTYMIIKRIIANNLELAGGSSFKLPEYQELAEMAVERDLAKCIKI
jgi:hypothetical protein